MIYIIIATMAIINARIDFDIIDNGKSPDHTKEALIRGAIILALSVFAGGFWWMIGLRFTSASAVFWIIFELALNWLRMKPLLYVGENAKTDLFFKSIFPTNTGLYLLIFKISLLISTICLMVHFGQA